MLCGEAKPIFCSLSQVFTHSGNQQMINNDQYKQFLQKIWKKQTKNFGPSHISIQNQPLVYLDQ